MRPMGPHRTSTDAWFCCAACKDATVTQLYEAVSAALLDGGHPDAPLRFHLLQLLPYVTERWIETVKRKKTKDPRLSLVRVFWFAP